MIASLRRIGTALLLVGVFSVSAGTLGMFAANCAGGTSCVANLIGISTVADTYPALDSVQVAVSTKQVQTSSVFNVGDMNTVLQGIGAYTILVAFVLLLALELFEVYYIRKLIRGFKLRAVTSR